MPWDQWHDDQNAQGSGSCTQTVFSILLPAAEVHEGKTHAPNPNSHYGVALKAYQDFDLAGQLDSVVTVASVASDVRDAAYTAWSIFHQRGSRYKQRQDDFDAADYPRIAQSLGCQMDFNPKDQ
jgi:hypothetical protein